MLLGQNKNRHRRAIHGTPHQFDAGADGRGGGFGIDHRGGETHARLLVEFHGDDWIGLLVADTGCRRSLVQQREQMDRPGPGYRGRGDGRRPAERTDRFWRRMPVAAVIATIDQQLATQASPIVLGVVVCQHFPGEQVNELVVADLILGCRLGVQLMPSVSLMPFSRRKLRFMVSFRPSTLL